MDFDKLILTQGTDTAAALTSVLFTLGLAYSALFLVTFARTYKQVFEWKKTRERDSIRRVFTYFYSAIYITLGLTVSLYFMLCTQALKKHAQANFGMLLLYFVPFILLLLCYIMIYH